MDDERRQVAPPIIAIGQHFKVEFIDLTHDGQGVAKINALNAKGEAYTNYPVFVPLALVGEQGMVELTKIKSDYALGRIIKLFPDKRSSKRIIPICKHYPACGGCHLMHMQYHAQLEYKKEMVQRTLEKIGGFTDIVVKEILGMEDPWYYRNKVQVPLGMRRDKTIAGFYQANSHNIIPMEECHIQSREMTEIVKFTRNLCNEFNLKGYNEAKHRGDLRHILIRESLKTKEIMVVLVCMTDLSLRLNRLIDKLIKRHPSITSVVMNINKDRTNEILGKYMRTLYGNKTIQDELLGNKFTISAKSFYQVNPRQTEVLYQKVFELGDFNQSDIVIDAYCGIGTIGIYLARTVKKVLGVEIVEDAIRNARENALLNGIDNIEFICSKAENQMFIWHEQGLKIDAIIVDPPRKGCDLSLLDAIVKMEISKIIYVSCDPASLARDLKYLNEHGYKINEVSLVDLFPQTHHVETVVSMSRA